MSRRTIAIDVVLHRVSDRRARRWLLANLLAGCALIAVFMACNTPPRDIISLLPTTVAGRTVSYQVEHGLGPFGDPGAITALLAREGLSPDALTTARAERFDPHVWVMAFRAPGVLPAKFVDYIVGDLDQWPETVGGKSVVRVGPSGVDKSRAGYLYVVDDTMVWIEADLPAHAAAPGAVAVNLDSR